MGRCQGGHLVEKQDMAREDLMSDEILICYLSLYKNIFERLQHFVHIVT